MPQANHSVFQAAMSLPPQSRAELAELLWASLPDQPLDPTVESQWLQEAKRRMKQVDDGHIELVPGEEVVERLRARMNQ